MSITKKCKASMCKNTVLAKGLCGKHYQRVSRYGDANLIKRVQCEDREKHPLCGTYRSMKQRCYSSTYKRYKDYGGRGIKVCDRWLGVYGFSKFVADMGDKPTPKHSLDRIDNDGNYEPSNCRWATWHEQQSNRRNNNSVAGVCYDKRRDTWKASMMVNGFVYSKYFKQRTDAIKYRKKLESENLNILENGATK